MADDRHARISEEAYRLWQAEGEPHGRDREHWDQAERAFAGESPVADEPDPQIETDAGVAAPAVGEEKAAGADAIEPTPSSPSDAPPAPAPAPKAAAKKPAARRKRST